MPATTILLIALAAIFALGFVFFKYFLGNKNQGRNIYFLAGLRFITIFLLLLLLINPEINQRELEIVKPGLFLTVDKSSSITHLGEVDKVKDFVQNLSSNEDLKERFEIKVYGFGDEIAPYNTGGVDFNLTQTNISKALNDVQKLKNDGQAAIVLITDGNQTVGENYEFNITENNTGIFPVIVGDTTAQIDLAISNLNVNKYAFINNDFPVEVLLNYRGKENVESRLEIKSGNAVIYSREVNFSEENSSEIVNITLPANNLGTSVYEAAIQAVASEKNTINNSRKFGVEVIDERTSVLLLSSVAHPDLGALKKSIEQNEQREATIEYIKNFNSDNISDYQLIILYQPNSQFNTIFEKIKDLNLNYLLITGTQTDWNFLNSIQKDFSRDHTNQVQDVFGIYNNNFGQFQFDDINFSRFPPLKDLFGSLTFNSDSYNPLLFQKIEGISTETPLLSVSEFSNQKTGILFGEDIWKWRSQSFLDSGTFEEFDNFIGKLVQYLASTQKRDRLTFENDAVFLENQNVLVTAMFFDQNYVFNPEGQLEIFIEEQSTKQQVRAPMLLKDNRYDFETTSLSPGEYKFNIREVNSNIVRNGNFVVLEYNIEQQFSSANLTGMKNLAVNNSASLYFLDNEQELVQELMNDNSYVSVQKSREKVIPLVDWKILLLLLVASLAAEWFMRKYFGLI